MIKSFTSNLLKVTALSAFVLGGASAYAQTEPLYLCDVATEAELQQDIFGVPMLIDNVAPYQYVARYYNTKANNEIYFLEDKTSFSSAYAEMYGGLGMSHVGDPDLHPIVLEEAGKYYEIKINTDDMEYSVETYEVADYMDPVIFEYNSNSLNQWFSYVDDGTDNWVPNEDAWMREFYFGYASGPGDVTPFVVDENNPHLYYWEEPQYFEEGEELNFIVHNWHDAGWWNFVTWRVDDSADCGKFYYYGGIVKKAYLDWYWAGEDIDWKQWKDSEDYRKNWVPDNWCKPTVPAAGDYVFYFDTHLGRGKMVPATAGDPSGIDNVLLDKNASVTVSGRNIKVNGDVKSVSLSAINGMRCNVQALSKNAYTTNVPAGIYILSYRTADGKTTSQKVYIK